MIFKQLFEPLSSTYTYLLGDPQTGQAILIDPVIVSMERDLGVLHDLGLTLAFTLDTHIHADHITAALALVMAGAILVALPAFRVAARRRQSLLGEHMHLPTATRVDRRLVLGSLAFGAGWGLAGFCPGPALASLATGAVQPLIFCTAMLAGMGIFELIERRRS